MTSLDILPTNDEFSGNKGWLNTKHNLPMLLLFLDIQLTPF
jgi:hypothetical protein